MSELENKVEELLRRAKKTTRSRYRASERLRRHHKFSQWTVSFLSVSLVFIPLLQVFRVEIGIEVLYLSAIQSLLAVLVLVYSLLLGQENFISRSEAMHRNGVELGRFARKLAAFNEEIPDEDYNRLVEEYYGILEKYENHEPIDYMFTRLHEKPVRASQWPEYAWLWMRAQLLRILIFSHYIVVLAFAFYVLYALMSALFGQSNI